MHELALRLLVLSCTITVVVVFPSFSILSKLAEFCSPLIFCYVLVLLKNAANKSSHFKPVHVKAKFTNDIETIQMLSFTDYVKALQAKRICLNKTATNSPSNVSNNLYSENISQFVISGMPHHGQNWQVPFIQCDSRRCQFHGEEAYQYCHYPKLGLAPSTISDIGGLERARAFREYTYQRYPVLTNTSLSAFQGQDFIQYFDSNEGIDTYIQDPEYGLTDIRPKLAMAIVFTGNDATSYDYSIRVNSTNHNAPEWAGSGTSFAFTTPDTKRLFKAFARREQEACAQYSSGKPQGPLQYSCTGQYLFNGLLTMQRFLHDWILEDAGARDKGWFVAEHGVKFASFPSKAYDREGFYGVLNEFLALFLVLGMLYPCASIISYISEERQLGQKEFLKMMSIKEWEIGCSWFCTFCPLHSLTALSLAGVSSQLFVRSSVHLLWFFWQCSLTALVVFSSALPSILFHKTKTATRTALVGLLLLLAGYFITHTVNMEEGDAFWQRLLCLHPVAAIAYGIQEIGRLEDAGIGLTRNSFHTNDTPSQFNMMVAVTLLLLDCLLWTLVSFYLNRVIPATEQGSAHPYYFPLMRSYWNPSSIFHHSPQQLEEEQTPFQPDSSTSKNSDIPIEPVSEALRQQANEGTNVEIHNLRKEFRTDAGSNIIAVDGLNLSLYKGQCTALLGHNGE